MKNLLLLLMSVLVLGLGGAAFAENRFFQTMPDVPLMEDMEELPEEAVIFDKPEGRFIETLARLNAQDEARVRNFYKETLPQLGWRMIRNDLFVRESETLQISFETEGSQKLLKLVIAPKEGIN